MTSLIRAETLHLRSLKSTYITALSVVLLTTMITVADFSETGSKAMDSSRELLESFMTTMTLVPAIGLGLFAATRAAGEFRYDTIAHRALAAPRRSHLVAAKVCAIAPFAALVVAVSVTAGAVAGSLAAGASGPALHVSAGAVAELIVGSTLFASLGVAVGFLSRNQTAAVLIVFGGWVFEKLLEAITQSGGFLPYALLSALAEDEVLAGLGLAAITAGALAASTHLLARKDVI
jgi:hypothetical protein